MEKERKIDGQEEGKRRMSYTNEKVSTNDGIHQENFHKTHYGIYFNDQFKFDFRRNFMTFSLGEHSALLIYKVLQHGRAQHIHCLMEINHPTRWLRNIFGEFWVRAHK